MKSILLFLNLIYLPLAFSENGVKIINFDNSYNYGNALVLDKKGNLLISGSAEDGVSLQFAWARLLPSGKLDETIGKKDGKIFQPILDGDSQIFTAAIDSDNRLLTAGRALSGADHAMALARFNPEGTLDKGFGKDGVVEGKYDVIPKSISLSQDSSKKSILVGGTWRRDAEYGYIVKYNEGGSFDTTFSTDGQFVHSNLTNIYSLVRDRAEKIIFAGKGMNEPNSAVGRLTSSGLLDTSFNTVGTKSIGFGGQGEVLKKVVEVENGIYYVGGYSSNEGKNRLTFARLFSNGSLDSTFHTDGKVQQVIFGRDDSLVDMVVDKKQRLTALSISDNGTSGVSFGLLRLNKDGSLDSTFHTDGKATPYLAVGDSFPSSLVLRNDGSVCAGGTSVAPAGLVLKDMLVACFLEDGNLDPNFAKAP